MNATDFAASPSSDGQQPTQLEIDHIVSLYESGAHAQMEASTRSLLERYPDSALAWSVLGMALQLQGKDALEALQRTVELAPHDAEAHLHLGNAHMDLGQADLAIGSFMRALELQPDFAEALSRLGLVLQAQGHLAEAAECYRGAMKIDPSLVAAHIGVGDILQLQRQFKAAEASYLHAATLAPGVPDIYCKLGDIRLTMGRHEQAKLSYGMALELDPAHAMAHGGMGSVFLQLANHEQAVASYRAAVQSPMATASHYHGLGRSLHVIGQTDEAEAAYRHAIDLDPFTPAAMLHYADLLRETMRNDQAIAIYRAALLLQPRNTDVLNNLGMALQENGELDQALAYFQQVQALTPKSPIPHCNIGSVLQAQGQRAAAMQSYRRALKIAPLYAGAHFNLGSCLMESGRLEESLKSYETAIKLDAQQRLPHVNMSATLSKLGRTSQAIGHCRQALKVNPAWNDLHSNLLFFLGHSGRMDGAALFAEHLRFGAQFEAPLRAGWRPHGNDRDPERRLRIGFVSGDFHNHAVANFLEPVLARLAGNVNLAMYGYYNNTIDDGHTKRMRSHMEQWRNVSTLADDAMANLIRADQIDVLIDLSGHTAGNRLPVFARKPAPLQASWMGYPGTTGLQAMDYFFSDKKILPAGEFDHLFLEKIVRLPISAPFTPYTLAPDVGPLPALTNGHLTFGSFNRANKLNRQVIALWSQVLRAIPDATMLLAGLEGDGRDNYLREWFAEEGINSNRLRLHRRGDMTEYMELHHQVDICLNTFPYTGTTTLCHALWMGVPTLSCSGNTIPSRASAAYLGHVGLEAFAAHDETDFVQKAVSWSQDIAALAALRADLRAQFIRSPIAQPALVSEGVERALRTMWRRWCQQLPAISFDAMHHDQALTTAEERLQ